MPCGKRCSAPRAGKNRRMAPSSFERIDTTLASWMARHGVTPAAPQRRRRLSLVRHPRVLPRPEPRAGPRRGHDREAHLRGRPGGDRGCDPCRVGDPHRPRPGSSASGLRATLLLLWLQMAGTITPLFLFPDACFTARAVRAHARGPVHHQERRADQRRHRDRRHRARRAAVCARAGRGRRPATTALAGSPMNSRRLGGTDVEVSPARAWPQ